MCLVFCWLAVSGRRSFSLSRKGWGARARCNDDSRLLGNLWQKHRCGLGHRRAADRLADMIRGFGRPQDFFDQFGGQDEFGSYRIIGRYHVSIFDDHDMVGRRDGKRRFLAGNNSENRFAQIAHAVGVQMTTLGIPCIYYGTEQAFDGSVDQHDREIDPSGPDGIPYGDRYLRECMFGGTFGAFQTEGCRFFDREHPTYLRVAALARVRNRRDMIGQALRCGRQYLRKVSADGGHAFDTPLPGELASWSRILHNQDVIITLNTHGSKNRCARVLLDSRFHPEGPSMRFLHRGDWEDEELKNPPSDQTVPLEYVEEAATVRINLSPAGMMILA